MPVIKEYNFEEARLIGIIAEKEIPQELQKSINMALPRKAERLVCLPFRVERAYLKNVLACMQLMDVEGLVLAGDFKKEMKRYVRLHESAQKKGLVNVISKEKGKFVGYYLEEGSSFAKRIIGLIIQDV